jgi:hypothetical protein
MGCCLTVALPQRLKVVLPGLSVSLLAKQERIAYLIRNAEPPFADGKWTKSIEESRHKTLVAV